MSWFSVWAEREFGIPQHHVVVGEVLGAVIPIVQDILSGHGTPGQIIGDVVTEIEQQVTATQIHGQPASTPSPTPSQPASSNPQATPVTPSPAAPVAATTTT